MRTHFSLATIGLLAGLGSAQQNAAPADNHDIAAGPTSTTTFRNSAAGDLDGDGLVDLFINRGDNALWMKNAGYFDSNFDVLANISDLARVRFALSSVGDDLYPGTGGVAYEAQNTFTGERYGIVTVGINGLQVHRVNGSGATATSTIDGSITTSTLVRSARMNGDSRHDIVTFTPAPDGLSTAVNIYTQGTLDDFSWDSSFSIPYLVEDAVLSRFDNEAGSEVIATFQGGLAFFDAGYGSASAGNEYFTRIIPGFTNVQVELLPRYVGQAKDGVLWAGKLGSLNLMVPFADGILQPPTVLPAALDLMVMETGHLNNDDLIDVVFTAAGEDRLYVMTGQSDQQGVPLFVYDSNAQQNDSTYFLQLDHPVLAGSQSKPLIRDLNDDGIPEIAFGVDQTNRVKVFGGQYDMDASQAFLLSSDWSFSTSTRDDGVSTLNTFDGNASSGQLETNTLEVSVQWTGDAINPSLGFDVAVFATDNGSTQLSSAAVGSCPGIGDSAATGAEKLSITWQDDPLDAVDGVPGVTFSAYTTATSSAAGTNNWGGTDIVLMVAVRPTAPNIYGRRPMIMMLVPMTEGQSWSTFSSTYPPGSLYADPQESDHELFATMGKAGVPGLPSQGLTPFVGAKRIKRSGFGNTPPVTPNDCADNNVPNAGAPSNQ